MDGTDQGYITAINQTGLGCTPTQSVLFASILPYSRSVQVGATASFAATVLNTGTSTATNCSVAPMTGVSSSFDYQASGAALNTPVTIPGNNGSKDFTLFFIPQAPMTAESDVQFLFACDTG
jgi:hypothetical protein